MKYEVVPADASHIPSIAAHCRQADIDEVWSAAAITITDALKFSLAHATLARTWLIDKTPAALGGITDAGENQGVIWLITTDLIEKHQRRFLIESRREMEKAKGSYQKLFNFVDVRNTRAIRWLRFMGFEMSEPMLYGVFRRPFHYFEMRVA